MPERDASEIKRFVRGRYARLAREGTSCCPPAVQACPPASYPAEELEGLPEVVSLGCGNPVGLAELRPGEVVLDLGSGGGLDCLLAAKRVGPAGRVIGLDMTQDMIALARRNAAQAGAPNVEFRLGEMERMPVESGSVDAIISNCVINLSPDKDAVFHEAFRVLKPGGRLVVSDLVAQGELPEAVRQSMALWASCLAGVLEEEDYLSRLRAAGFAPVERLSKAAFAPKIASVTVRAVKPMGPGDEHATAG